MHHVCHLQQLRLVEQCVLRSCHSKLGPAGTAHLCFDVLKQRVDLLCYLSVETPDSHVGSNRHVSWVLSQVIASTAPTRKHYFQQLVQT